MIISGELGDGDMVNVTADGKEIKIKVKASVKVKA